MQPCLSRRYKCSLSMYLSIQYNKSKNFVNNVSAIQLHGGISYVEKYRKTILCTYSEFFIIPFYFCLYETNIHVYKQTVYFSSKRVTTIKSAQKQNKYECGFYEGMQCAQKWEKK